MRQILLIMLGLSITLYADFTKSGNIVADNSTGLQWQDDVNITKTWTEAIDHCEALSLDGHSDWRLPNLKELTSIVDDTRTDPSIDTVVFQNAVSDFYWSSTTLAGYSGSAWYVYFYNGRQNYRNKDYSRYVRCVRAGQFDSLPIVKVHFISEVPQDDTLQLEPFTKEWTFGEDLIGYSVEVVSSNYASYASVNISGNTVSVDLVPDTSTVINTIILKLKDPDGANVLIDQSEIFWARVRTSHPPRLADGQPVQMVGAAGDTLSMDVETFDGNDDSVSMSVKNSNGGSVSFSGNTLNASFSDSETIHTVTITLDDGKESVDINITVLSFDSSTIETFYSDVDINNHNHHFSDIAAATLEGIVWGQADPDDDTLRIYRPDDSASMAEVLKMIIGTAYKAGLVELESAPSYLNAYPAWSMPYYTFAREHGAVSDLGGDLSILYPTREEIAQILVKVLGLDDKLSAFPDINVTFNDESDFSNEAMIRYAQITRIFGLFLIGDFAIPQGKSTRAEITTLIRKILMMPKADVAVNPDVIEYGDILSIGLENITARKVSLTDYTLIDSTTDVSLNFAMNLQLVDTPQTYDSSLMQTQLPNQLVSLMNNNGIYNIVVQDINVSFSDIDGDGISDRYDDNNTDGPLADNDSDGDVNYLDLDDDNDGMSDKYEILYGLNPLDDSDASEDTDGDGYTNLEEYERGTSPIDPLDYGRVNPAVIMYLLH